MLILYIKDGRIVFEDFKTNYTQQKIWDNFAYFKDIELDWEYRSNL